jgi:PAS domain S-box-containing protein
MDVNNRPDADVLSDEEQETFFQKAIAEFPDNIFTSQIHEDRLISLNVGKGVADLLGYETWELASEPELWFEIIHPADEKRVRTAFTHLASGKPLAEVYRVFRKTGQLLWIRLSAVACKDLASGVCHIMGIVSDAATEKPTIGNLVQYKQLLDTTPNPVCIRNTSGEMIYCNKAYYDFIGQDSIEDALLTTCRDVIPPEDMEWFEREVWPKILSEPWQGEIRLMCKDGQIKDVRLSTNVLHDPDGETIGIYSTFLDLTELKRTDKALRESEEKYRTLVERSNDGIVVLQDFEIKLANERFSEMSGYPKDQLIGTNFSQLLVPEERVFLQDRYVRRMAGELVPQNYEIQLTRADGSKTDVDINAGVITYEGKPADLVMFRDVSQRKRAEEALRESEERFRTLVDNVDAIIVRIGADLRPITVGEQIEKWTGYSTEKLIKNPNLWQNLVSAEDSEKIRSASSKALRDKKTVTIEIKLKHISGQERWLRGRLTPRFDALGNLVYWDGVGMDITERVEAVERETRHARLIAALVDMSQVFVSTHDTNKIMSIAVKSTGSLLNCLCSILTLDQESGRFHPIAGYSTNGEKWKQVHDAFEKIGIGIEDIFGPEGLRPGISADLTLKSPKSVEFALVTGMRSSIAVPIYVEGVVFGVFTNGRMQGEKAFDDEDLWFMSEVASHVSAALTNASLYRRQARIAETLQRSLIPDEVTVRGLETATSYLPAAGEVGVGGDFFDVIVFDDGKVGLVVGDVSGKGLDAAIHTAEAKYMLRGYANQNPEPGYVISALNEALYAYMGEFTFVTMFYGLIDPANHFLEYVNAGHESPLVLCRNTGRVYELAPSGMILGIQRNPHYISRKIDLAEDDFLFCYTDGLIDAKCNGDRFGYERLKKTIEQSKSRSSQELLDYVCYVVHECSAMRTDDQVVVVIRVL